MPTKRKTKEFDPYKLLMESTPGYPRPKKYVCDVPTDKGYKTFRASSPKILRKEVYEQIKKDRRMFTSFLNISVEYRQVIAPNKVAYNYAGRFLITAFDKDIYWEGKSDSNYGKVQPNGSIIKGKWPKIE